MGLTSPQMLRRWFTRYNFVSALKSVFKNAYDGYATALINATAISIIIVGPMLFYNDVLNSPDVRWNPYKKGIPNLDYMDDEGNVKRYSYFICLDKEQLKVKPEYW